MYKRERMNSSHCLASVTVYLWNQVIFHASSYDFPNCMYLCYKEKKGAAVCMSAGCSPSPLTHPLVWKHLGGLAPLGSGLSAQADLLPRKVFWESSLEGKKIIYWASHNTLKTLPLGKLTFLALEATLCREPCEFCEIRSLQNFFSRIFVVLLEEGWTVARQLTSLWFSVDSGCSPCSCLSSGLEKRPCHLLQIPLFFHTSSFRWEDEDRCWFSVTLSEVGEGVLSLVLTLVWEQPSRSTRRFPVVPASDGAGPTCPSWTACPYLPSQLFV